MPAYNLDIDFTSGTIVAVGKDGRRHGMEAIAAAERAAAGGDAEAAALLASVDFGLGDDGAPLDDDALRARLDQIVHDCPECRAARARGEEPLVLTGAELLQRLPPPPPWLADVLDDAARSAAWCSATGDLDEPPIAWRASDLISFGPGAHHRRRERRRARARRRRLFA